VTQAKRKEIRFVDFHGIEFRAKDLHQRLVTLFTDIFHTAWKISRAENKEELEFLIRKAETQVKITNELIKLYNLLVQTAKDLYKVEGGD